jgi:LacI family transcriptional regulator
MNTKNGPRVHRPRQCITIADLAKHLRLAKGTVSRALNGYPDIAANTRARVEEAAKALGYRASPLARGLATGRVQTLGLVLGVDTNNAHKPFLSDFIDGLSRHLTRENWTLSVATSESMEAALALFERLATERRVDGFVLPRTLRHDPRVALLRELDVPFVLFGRTEGGEALSWYDVANDRAMAAAVARLAALGHRRVAFLGGAPGAMSHHYRIEGYRQGMAAAGLPVDEALIRQGAMTQDTGEALAAALLDLPDPPTALIHSLDRAALGAYRAVEARGLRVGHDVSIIGFDGIPEGAFATPDLTTFSVDMRLAGERLAALFLRRMAGERPETLQELVEATFIPRGSDGPAPGTR